MAATGHRAVRVRRARPVLRVLLPAGRVHTALPVLRISLQVAPRGLLINHLVAAHIRVVATGL